MFCFAESFNQPLNLWNTTNVINMNSMFSFAYSFTYVDSLASWNVSNVTNMGGMFNDIPQIKIRHYCLILEGWSALPSLNPGIQFSVVPTQYYSSYQSYRNIITSRGWNLIDGGIYTAIPMSLTFQINSLSGSGPNITLPLHAYVDVDVDWGDSSSSNYYNVPNNYNPADFYINTLAIVPSNKDESKAKVEVTYFLYLFILANLNLIFFFKKICDYFSESQFNSKLNEEIKNANVLASNPKYDIKLSSKIR
jgi:surface protein